MAPRRIAKTSKPQRFRTRIQERGGNPCVDVPESASRAFAPFAVAGRISFDGTLRGVPVRGTLVPVKGGGHRLYVNGAMRGAAAVDVGDTVTFVLRATAPGLVRPPPTKRIAKGVEPANGRPTRAGRPKAAAVVTRATWTCPRCGSEFVNEDQRHSCRPGDVDETFRGKPAFVRELFDRFREIVESCGPVKILPYRDKVGFMVRIRFAGAIPRQRWLEVGFWLPRRIDDPRMYRVETLDPHVHVHRLRVTKLAELDEQLTKWLREAYAVGCAEHLAAAVG